MSEVSSKNDRDNSAKSSVKSGTTNSAPRDDDAPHEGPIKTPKQLVLAVVASFVIPIGIILLLATFVETAPRPAAGSDAFSKEATAERIQRIGLVEVKDQSDVASMKNGEQVFTAQCSACHATGAAGAPKFGDTAAWGPRIGQGYDVLLDHALHGKGAMPAQGGGDFSDYEIGRAVVYMADKGGATFPEPKPPAAAASGAEVAGSAPVTADAGAAAAATSAVPAMAANAVVAQATPTAAASPAPAQSPAPAPATATPAAAAGAVPALFTQVCATCHASGVAGAPKVGDKAAWGPRLAQGIDGLTASAIKGKGAMPPRGGSQASDADIKAVVTYFVSQAK
jgi:cytochrome c5